MESEWKVKSQYIGGDYVYEVYRVIDVSKTVHSGNIECAAGSYTMDKQAALEMARKLNEEEIPCEK